MAWNTWTVKLTHRVWSGRNGTPPAIQKMRRAQERGDEPEQARHLEADVLLEVVVQAAAHLHGAHDGGEVVVREDHHGGLLGDLRAGDAHGDADVRALQRRRVVDAVAGHGHDMALAL